MNEIIDTLINTRREELIDALKAHASGGTLSEPVANRIVGALTEIDHLPEMIESIKAENLRKMQKDDETS